MFSLIISIIAIALVAALAGASVYYGGSAFNEGTAGADASTLINAGQQINGAVALATAQGDWSGDETDLDSLSPDYLTQLPNFQGTDFTLDTSEDSVEIADVSADVCDEVNERAGGEPADADAVELFGCYEDGTDPRTFAYRI